jgi:hypothetical protein
MKFPIIMSMGQIVWDDHVLGDELSPCQLEEDIVVWVIALSVDSRCIRGIQMMLVDWCFLVHLGTRWC